MQLNKKVQDYLKTNEITLIVTFSRQQMVEPFFDAFNKIDMPRSRINLIIFDNTENNALHGLLQSKLSNLPFNKKDGFKSIYLHISGRKGGATLLGMENKDFYKSKLNPIWEMWRDMIKLVKTPYFIVLEDDTIVPKHAIIKLLNDLFSLDNAGNITMTAFNTTYFNYTNSTMTIGYHNVSY